MLWERFVNSFIALLVIANPLGASAVYVGLLGYADTKTIRQTALRAVLVAGGLLFFFALVGEPFLGQLGVTIPSFRVAGGLLLFSIAFRMLFGENDPEAASTNPRHYSDRRDIAVFPLGIPLIAGPGAITATIILMGKAADYEQKGMVLLAIGVVMLTTLAALCGARGLQKAIGASGANIIARVMGLILAAKSVQFVVEGIQGINFHFTG